MNPPRCTSPRRLRTLSLTLMIKGLQDGASTVDELTELCGLSINTNGMRLPSRADAYANCAPSGDSIGFPSGTVLFVSGRIDGDTVEKEENRAARSERCDFRNAGVRLVRQETVVLLVDLVESVRLMQEHEDYTVRRWAEFVRIVDTQILPRYDGVVSFLASRHIEIRTCIPFDIFVLLCT